MYRDFFVIMYNGLCLHGEHKYGKVSMDQKTEIQMCKKEYYAQKISDSASCGMLSILASACNGICGANQMDTD